MQTPRMKRSIGALATLAALALGGAASGAEVQLTSVLYPDRTNIDVPFAVTAIGPKAATVSAEVNFRDGQARIEVSWTGMQPAIMFAGNITSYALFAVTKDGLSENLGEVAVLKPNGSRKFQTGQKDFALIITAEPVTGTPQPSNLVVFTSGGPSKKTAKPTPFKFNRFANEFWQQQIKPGNPSIANLPMFVPGAEPVELTTARKLVEMAQAMKLAPEFAKNVDQAKVTLAQATNTAAAGGSSKVVTDYAARAGSLASEAIRGTVRKDYEAKLSAEDARKLAEKASLEKGLAQTSAQLSLTEKQKAEIEALLAQVRVEKAQVEAEKSRIEAEKAQVEAEKSRIEAEKAVIEADRVKVKAERDALAERLAGALGKIMATRQTARGITMDLGDVLYDVNKATLKTAARESLAKLSGVLLMLPDVNVRIEGFTDSTGTAERNKTLSAERAQSVFEFLKVQGIDASRMAHAGYGPANPVASNDTKEGKAKNRRVEMTFAQGTIEPTPGGYTAPDKPAAPAKPVLKPAAKKAPAKAAAPAKTN
jgi:outer membrane protein OmpA-like peptidoglycan-associated protein